MSITVKSWTKKELKSIKNRTADDHLITVFMNGGTFGENEIMVYPYDIRKTYFVYFEDQDEPIKFYAVTDESALWFLEQEYNTACIIDVCQQITTYRTINIRGIK